MVTVTEYRKRAAAAMDEATLQQNVILKAEVFKWLWWHDTDSRRNLAGMPDLILLRPPRLIFAELKSQNGRVRKAQKRWIELLRLVPCVEMHVWRPLNLLSGEIESVLR